LIEVGDLVVFLVIVAVAGTVGIAFGIFFMAPRISRLIDRSDEEPGARDD
jgi:hypothetical protein